MLFFLLDVQVVIGLLKILGEPSGDLMDTFIYQTIPNLIVELDSLLVPQYDHI